MFLSLLVILSSLMAFLHAVIAEAIECGGEMVSCGFEPGDARKPACAFLVAGDFPWTVQRGPTDQASTGPHTDHTLKTTYGTYMYLSAALSSPGDICQLITGPLSAVGPADRYRVNFWYHRYGQHIGQLKLYEIDDKRNILPTDYHLPAGSYTEPADALWQEGSLVTSPSARYVMFEAVRGGSVAAHTEVEIALDDIQIMTCDVDYCEGVNCSGHGECSDQLLGYECSCDQGYEGEDCEIEVDDCLGIDCNSRGWCVDLAEDYICICTQSDYSGKQCEHANSTPGWFTVTIEGYDDAVIVGEEIRLVCVASEEEKDVGFMWVLVQNGLPPSIIGHAPRYVKANAETKDAGRYTCAGRFDEQTATHTTTVHVVSASGTATGASAQTESSSDATVLILLAILAVALVVCAVAVLLQDVRKTKAIKYSEHVLNSREPMDYC